MWWGGDNITDEGWERPFGGESGELRRDGVVILGRPGIYTVCDDNHEMMAMW